MKNPEKAQHQNFLNAVYNAKANAKSVQNGDHPEKNELHKKIGYSAKNDKNQSVCQEYIIGILYRPSLHSI